MNLQKWFKRLAVLLLGLLVMVGICGVWAIMFLSYGVTTVRDMGSADGSIFKFREQVRNGALPGPRIFAAGPVLDGSPAAFPSNRVVTTPEEARQAVDEAAAQGADFIKAYHMLSPECIAAIKEQAITHGLRVVGHVPLTTPVESGLIEDVQHLTGIPVSPDLQALLDDRAEWSLEDALKIDDARIDALAEAFLKNNTAYTPTMINPRMRRKQGGAVADSQDDAIEILPTLWKDTWGFIFGTPFTPGTAGEKEFEQQRKKFKEVTFKLYRAGVEIHAGPDAMMPYVVPGKSLHGELEELVDAGLSTEEAFAVATSVAGAWLADDGLGQVVAGGPADFLIFSADPIENMENLDTLAAVVADGRLYTRAYLDQSIETYRDHFHGNLYESVMGLPMKLGQRFYAPD